MERVLEGRRAIVTGAAGGLGAAFTRALVGAGVAVAVCDRDPAVVTAFEDLGPTAVALAEVVDVASDHHVAAFVARAAEALQGIDILINNAAVVELTDPQYESRESALATFDRLIAINLRAPFSIAKACIPHLRNAESADIVNITTDHMRNCGFPVHQDHSNAPDCAWKDSPKAPGGGPNLDVYDASKYALNGMTLAWARALRSAAIRVNSFGMGAADTPMYREYIGNNMPAAGLLDPLRVADLLVQLLAEGPQGRTGDDVQIWAGHPYTLPAPYVALDTVLAKI